MANKVYYYYFLSGVLNWSTLLRASLMRWSVSAHDVVFTEQFNSWLFGVGKGVPVIRGAGVYQVGDTRGWGVSGG